MRSWSFVLLCVAALAAGCGSRQETSRQPMIPVPPDPSSYASVAAFVVKHLVLDLTADFDRRTLAGTAELQVERRESAATELVLDTRDLTIQKVEAASSAGGWAATPFTLDAATPAFGSALRVTMPADAARVRVTYVTAPAVPVHPGAGDPGAVVHSFAGPARRARDL